MIIKERFIMNTKKCLTHLLAFLLCLYLSPSVFAQSGSQDVSSINRVGTTAGAFLKIGAGARAIGLGSAYTAQANDILSLYWNPAGLSRIVGNGEAIFNHANWLAETSYDFAAFSVNLNNVGTVGVSVTSLRTPEQPVRTIENPEGTGQLWDASMIAVGVSYAKNLTDKFSIGFTGKFIQERIFNESAFGGAFDIGVLYNTPFKNLTLGASISNFGTKMQLDGRDLYFNEDPQNNTQGNIDNVASKYRTDPFELPLSMRFGLAWKAVTQEDYSVTAIVDGVQPNDNSEYLNTGLEMALKNALFLRAGYKGLLYDDGEEGLTFGAGIKYSTVGTHLNFDFGWADFGRLENVKFVSFSVKY